VSPHPALALSLATSRGTFARALAEGRKNPGPGFLLPALPPTLLVVALTSLFGGLRSVISFPTGSFEQYFVPGAMAIVAVAGGGFTSGQLASDFRSDFIDRLRLSGGGSAPSLLGRLAFECLRVIPGAVIVLAVGLLLGGAAPNGVPGALTAISLVSLTSAAYAGLFYVAAILTEDPQTPLNLNPLGSVIAFLSTAFVPRSAMPGWMSAVAHLNPMTRIVDGTRAAMIGQLASTTVLVAFATAAGGLALTIAASVTVHNHKLRTR
jgi:ABC-2 type transport system permease protein